MNTPADPFSPQAYVELVQIVTTYSRPDCHTEVVTNQLEIIQSYVKFCYVMKC